jgi:GST-like protein
MVIYLADKYDKEGKFMPKDARKRADVMNWSFWQMAGQGPMTGNFGLVSSLVLDPLSII